MQKHLVQFEKMPWIETGEGVRCKIFKNGSRQIRLIEFSEGFTEKNWCLHGHMGYVLEGSCLTDFNGKLEQFNAGDIVFIPDGDGDKHKMIISMGGRVLLLLFETV